MPKVLDTPLEISPGFFANLVALWAGMSWLSGRQHPGRPWPTRLLVGAVAGIALVLADVGHACAHSVSARLAGAPMDRIKLSSGMPRTIYDDEDVPPRTHRMRAMGGPIFSAWGLVASLLVRAITPRKSIAHEVANWSSIGHGLIFAGSLAPLPIVDGGSLLKWTLVDHGRTTDEADRIVQQAGVATGIAATSAGVAFATQRRWLPALGLIAAGLVAIGSALGKIR
ncbi:MAG: hypothetical protein JSV69_15215 [Chloroflexota bacterium]|nr:MAG: hypothetical protein JSV69_15215 [Chloroflexota bacterium]